MRYGLYRGLTWVAWILASPWLYARRRSGSQEWRERGGSLPPCPGGIWVHAASVGEVAAAAPLVSALAARGEQVLLTVLTPTGRSSAARLEGESVSVAFPPLDLPPFVETALNRVAPRALLVVETELWPNLIVSAASRGVRVGIVNGRLSPSSVRRYGSPAFPVASVVEAVEFVACRSHDDAGRYRELGFGREKLLVAGGLKYDTLPGPPADSEHDAARAEIGAAGGVEVVIFGSVRPAEEEAIGQTALRLVRGRRCRVVIAPRHLARADAIRDRLSSLGLKCARRSEGADSAAGAEVILLDTTGELARLYAAADVAFVGGTLAPYGGHNPLEPAAAGVPVVIGPHTSSCEDDATALIEGGGAVRVGDERSLLRAIVRILDDAALRDSMRGKGLATVSAGRGAAGRIIEHMSSSGILPGPGTEAG